MDSRSVTLQVSLAPTDLPHARHLLPHQLRTWRGQVREVLLTVDLHRSMGRFSAGWETGRDGIFELARSMPGVAVREVDYGEEARQRVSAEFFGGAGMVPAKDFRGGPFYAYFFALAHASTDFVLHLDSDMFFGGGSSTWLDEALAVYAATPRVLVMAPLPGPPAADGRLHSQLAAATPDTAYSFDFDSLSTRLFLISRRRFHETVGALRLRPPPGLRNRAKALIEGNPNHDLPEHLFTHAMRAHGLIRREFLGRSPGMWHLHPPYRAADFYHRLPDLIAQIERGDMPARQRGDHDLNASMVDWAEALARLRTDRWWRRLLHR